MAYLKLLLPFHLCLYSLPARELSSEHLHLYALFLVTLVFLGGGGVGIGGGGDWGAALL